MDNLVKISGGGNAEPKDVLSGKTFRNNKGQQTGAMIDRSAWKATINAGGSITIPAGYHDGSGRVSANNGSNPAIKYHNHSSADGATSLTYTFDSYGKYRVCATAHAEAHNGNLVEFYTNGSIVSTHYSHMWSKGGGTYGGIGEDASGTGLIFLGDIVASSGNRVKVLTKETKSFVTLCVEKLAYWFLICIKKERNNIMKLNDKLYDILCWIGRIVIPSLAVLYTTLGDIWGLPYTSEIPATIMGLDVFLNALLGISSNTYYKEKANQNTEV